MGVAPANASPNGGGFARRHSIFATARTEDHFRFRKILRTARGNGGLTVLSFCGTVVGATPIGVHLSRKARKPPAADTEVVRRDARSTFHERNGPNLMRFSNQVEGGTACDLGVVFRAASVSREAGFSAFRVKILRMVRRLIPHANCSN